MPTAKHLANSKTNCLPHNAHQTGKQADGEKSRINTRRNTVQAENSFPHKSNGRLREGGKVSPKNQNRQIALDTPRRGRPGISPDEYPEILGRAEHFRYMLSETTRTPGKDKPESLWDKVREPLLGARTEEEVENALKHERYGQDFVPHLNRQILKTINDPRFPKNSDARVNFLADSIAALGRVSPRRSRNICQKQRRKREKGLDTLDTAEAITEPLANNNRAPSYAIQSIERDSKRGAEGGKSKYAER